MRNKSLYLQVMILLITVSLMMNVALILIVGKRAQKEVEARIINDAYLILESINWALAPLLENDSNVTQRLIENVSSSDFIHSLKVLNSDQVIYSNNELNMTNGEKNSVDQILSLGRLQYYERDGDRLLAAVPIHSEDFNIQRGSDVEVVLVLSVSSEYEQDLIDTFRHTYSLTYFLVVLIALLVVILALNFLINRPMKVLSKAMYHASKRDYSQHVDIRTNGDFKQLSQEYNRMVDDIATYTRDLEITRQLAVEATMEKSKFLANVSHELLTPLTTINGYVSLLHEEEDSKDKQEQLKTVLDSSYHLQSVLEDILDVYDLETDQIVLNNQYFDIRHMLQSLHDLYRAPALKKNLNLSFSVYDQVPDLFLADEDKIKQVFDNLIKNSIKFTNAGYIKVQVDYVKNMLQVRVVDSGIGIEKVKLDLIFDMFSQQDNSITRSFGGLGLGLTICKGIVDAYGGQISVSSKLREGTSFLVTLPLKTSRSGILNKWLTSDDKLRPLIISFVKRFNDICQQLERGSFQERKDLIHMLKGTSGNLRLSELYVFSERLYKMTDDDHFEKSIKEFIKFLRRLYSELPKQAESIHILSLGEIELDQARISLTSLDFIEKLFVEPYNLVIVDTSVEGVAEVYEAIKSMSIYKIAIIGPDDDPKPFLEMGFDWFLSQPVQMDLLKLKIKSMKEGFND